MSEPGEIRAVGQQVVCAVALHAEARAEGAAAVLHMQVGVVEDGLPGCLISGVPQHGQGKP